MKVIFCKGLPASGKSTWADQYIASNKGWIKIEKDEIRSKMQSENGKKRQNENAVIAEQTQLLERVLGNGFNVIISDTNLNPVHEQRIRAIADNFDAEFEIKSFLDVSYMECIIRDAKRPNSVGVKVISDMWHRWVEPYHIPKVNLEEDAPPAVICDLDGTLALMNGRSPYESEKCDEDLVNKAVAFMISIFQDRGICILYTSGRDSKFYDKTLAWLKKNNLFEPTLDKLIMRPEGDIRPDSTIKKELYEEHIKGKFNVKFALDDRSRVVFVWRSLGIPCFQVNYGDF